jgi:hypothetical protein
LALNSQNINKVTFCHLYAHKTAFFSYLDRLAWWAPEKTTAEQWKQDFRVNESELQNWKYETYHVAVKYNTFYSKKIKIHDQLSCIESDLPLCICLPDACLPCG